MRRLALLLVTALLAGCSVAGGDEADGRTTVTFRLWDEQVAKAYEQSFAAFEKAHPDIRVAVQLVPWADYWTKLPADIAAGTAADIYWTNTSNFGLYADNGQLLPVEPDPGWTPSVVQLYTRHGKLWGVPQLWDSIALYYNNDLVSAAGVDPATLTWDPTGRNDTFRAAARRLTVDSAGRHAGEAGFDPDKIRTYGFNAAFDQQAILWDFVGSNGGTWQNGDTFDFADQPKTVQAVQYLVDLINSDHVAPSAADTNTNGDKALQLFTQGKLALFQSGPYHLKSVQEGAGFRWGLAPMLRGPAGRVGVVHGVAAVASAKTPHRDATVAVLDWIGSADGIRPIAEGGYAFPGVTAAQPAFVEYWRKRGVDLQPFLDSSTGTTFPAPVGPRVGAGGTAYTPILQQVFLGRLGVAPGLRQAQDAGNAAMKG
ncbi:ABC transporter substrate-binding protein [Actinoplanes teichomyceticus]|uniref:Carbohydrate ABC transporter substrate-binding protein (CUT1 family) n=1 Tax=Actinoplanes teichomyceticus TaxID=1867 RepID=A0A561WA17_ACTTI|nr:sugar ABC transporter substrate-binding protein [Actinoplanes teichomyceticus]TWG20707.1 carbohydrate ABC transporter substrate-binding protein (CUT1 family) [Actinoplanes teichomyceticus]GIF14363.1 sugar ABC transporter substrate-binding protein [Actinoplanes teichomyceticus]